MIAPFFSIVKIFIIPFDSNEQMYTYIVNQSNAYLRFVLDFFVRFNLKQIVDFQFVFRIPYESSYNLKCGFVAFILKIFHANKLVTMYCVVNPFTLQIVHQLENNNSEQIDTEHKTSNE